MRVFVYWNLHKKCFSVKALEGPNKGRVIAHRDTVHLKNPTFRVSQAGRARVIKEQKKNVHAGVVGFLAPSIETNNIASWEEAYYNPYKTDRFVNRYTGNDLEPADLAVLIDKQIVLLKFISENTDK